MTFKHTTHPIHRAPHQPIKPKTSKTAHPAVSRAQWGLQLCAEEGIVGTAREDNKDGALNVFLYNTASLYTQLDD